jgi:redox-sensitive bicupin YhaK (pirin superfamily)
MIKLRKSEDRGSNQFYWLDSKHSFSFGEYHDPKFVHYGVLRVLNEDRVIPKGGFAPHF